MSSSISNFKTLNISIVGRDPTTKAIEIKAASGQTANLIEIKDSSDNVIGGFNSVGNAFSIRNNIFSGTGSGSNVIGTADENICLGYNATLPITTGSGQMNIGNVVYGTGLNTSVKKIGINVTNPSAQFQVNSTTTGSVTLGVNAIAGQASNIVDVKSNTGISRFIVDAAGNVGVGRQPGVAFDVQSNLSVFRDISGVVRLSIDTNFKSINFDGKFVVSAGNGNSYLFDTNSRFSVGTATPTARLHGQGNASYSAFRVQSQTEPTSPNDGDIWQNASILKYRYGAATTNFCFTDIVQSYTKQQYFAETTLTDAASISWDLDSNQTTSVTLTANRTLANPTNMKAGATYVIRVIQGGTGSYTLSFGSAYVTSEDSAVGYTKTIATAIGEFTTIAFYCDGTNMIAS